MKKISLNLKVSILLFVVYVGTYVIDLFTTKAITLSSVILCVGALIAYTIFLSRLKPMYYLGILGFTFMAQYLGAMLDVYDVIPIYDLLLHFASGGLLVFLADYVYTLLTQKHKNISVPDVIRLGFAWLASVASAAVWEIWEYSGDKLFGLDSQISLDDTMSDIIAGTCGAIIGVFLLRALLKRMKKKA